MTDDNKKNEEELETSIDDEDFDSFEGAADDNDMASIDEELEEFEDWQADEEPQAEEDILDEDYAPEDISAGSIEEDFSDFESQVISDQAALAKKTKTGGIVKFFVMLLMLGGIIGGGAYGYLTYEDEIMALISPPSIQTLEPLPQEAALPGQNSGTAPSPIGNNADIASEEPVKVPGLDQDTNIESFLPQPTPISETDIIAEPEMLASPMDASPSLSEVIDNSQESLYDAQREESVQQGQPNQMIAAEALTDVVAANVVEQQQAVNQFVNNEVVEPVMNQVQEVVEVVDTATDFTDELYDPNEYEQAQEIVTDIAQAASNKGEQVMSSPEPVTNDASADIGEVTIVNPSNAIPSNPIENKVEEKISEVVQAPSVSAVEPKPAVAVSARQEVASRNTVEAPAKNNVEIPETKPKFDPYKAERNTTVYNLIQNQDLQMARRALSQQRYEDSLKIFDRLFQENPDNYDIAIGRALSLQYLGYNQEALKAYNGILASNPSDPIANNNKEIILSLSPNERAKQPVSRVTSESSKRSANVASSISSGSNDILLAKQAVSLAQQGKQQEAIDMIEKAMRIAPNNPMHVYNAAIIYDQAGQTSRAIKFYERALELDSISGMDNNLPRGLIYDRLSVIR